MSLAQTRLLRKQTQSSSVSTPRAGLDGTPFARGVLTPQFIWVLLTSWAIGHHAPLEKAQSLSCALLSRLLILVFYTRFTVADRATLQRASVL